MGSRAAHNWKRRPAVCKKLDLPSQALQSLLLRACSGRNCSRSCGLGICQKVCVGHSVRPAVSVLRYGKSKGKGQSKADRKTGLDGGRQRSRFSKGSCIGLFRWEACGRGQRRQRSVAAGRGRTGRMLLMQLSDFQRGREVAQAGQAGAAGVVGQLTHTRSTLASKAAVGKQHCLTRTLGSLELAMLKPCTLSVREAAHAHVQRGILVCKVFLRSLGGSVVQSFQRYLESGNEEVASR